MSTMPLSINMQEWEERSPETDASLAGVTLGHGTLIRETARELSRSGKLEIVELRSGLLLRTSSFVGRLDLGDLRITIRPKIPFDPLLTLLRYAYDLRDLRLYSETAHSALPDAFQELLIHQLWAEASELIARGLQRRYTQVKEDLPTPRGRINIQQIARQGGVVEASIPCTHYPRLEDSLVNQVLLAGLHLAAGLTTNLMLRTQLRRLAAVIEEHVSHITLNADVMRRLDRQLNRLTAAYEPALTLIALLLEASGIALDEPQPGLRLPGFLFDMNRFFEALMSRFLRDNLPGYTVQDQYQLRGMMRYVPEHNPRRRQAPTPRPDYVVSRDGEMVAMLDAKYRDIWTNGLPRDMLYQLAIYALSQGLGGQATILYPTVEPSAKPEVIDIREVVHGEYRAQVVLRPVDLIALTRLIDASGIRAQRERGNFARKLCFEAQAGIQIWRY